MNQKVKSPLSLNEFKAVIRHSMAEVLSDFQDNNSKKVRDRKIYGIKGLMEFLDCSSATAVKFGRSGKFPRYQEGRKIFFYESEVLDALHN